MGEAPHCGALWVGGGRTRPPPFILCKNRTGAGRVKTQPFWVLCALGFVSETTLSPMGRGAFVPRSAFFSLPYSRMPKWSTLGYSHEKFTGGSAQNGVAPKRASNAERRGRGGVLPHSPPNEATNRQQQRDTVGSGAGRTTFGYSWEKFSHGSRAGAYSLYIAAQFLSAEICSPMGCGICHSIPARQPFAHISLERK